MKVKLANAATFVYKGRIYHKGEIFEISDREFEKYRFILEKIEDPKKNRKKKGEG